MESSTLLDGEQGYRHSLADQCLDQVQTLPLHPSLNMHYEVWTAAPHLVEYATRVLGYKG